MFSSGFLDVEPEKRKRGRGKGEEMQATLGKKRTKTCTGGQVQYPGGGSKDRGNRRGTSEVCSESPMRGLEGTGVKTRSSGKNYETGDQESVVSTQRSRARRSVVAGHRLPRNAT